MRIILFMLISLVATCPAQLTLIQRETFQGVGTLNTASPGNLGTVTGSFYKRAVGPKVVGDGTANGLGWSADNQSGVDFSLPHGLIDPSSTAAASLGMVSGYYYAASGGAFSKDNALALLSIRISNGVTLGEIRLKSNGNIAYFSVTSGGEVDSGIAFPYSNWCEFRAAWQIISQNTYNIGLYYRIAGSTTWNTIHEYTAINGNAGATITKVYWGMNSNGGSFRGRFGMPTLYALGSYSDRTALSPDVVDPVNTHHTWYVNPATGSDANDGVTPSTAWSSVGKINAESKYCGLFPTDAGYANGDTLQIDTSNAPLVLASSTLNINTRGLNFIGTNRVAREQSSPGVVISPGIFDIIQAEKNIAADSWSGPISGTTKVYSTSDMKWPRSCGHG